METFATGSHDWPPTDALDAFMAGGWADTERRDLAPLPVAGWAAKRRELLRAAFPGERIVVPSGVPARRSNDQDHRFRPHSDYVWLTGDQHPGRVLVVDPDGATLYAQPRSRRDNGEFYRSRAGELWVGRRPSLAESSVELDLPCRDIAELEALLGNDIRTRLRRGTDPGIDALRPAEEYAEAELAAVLSELRLVKDEYEIEQVRLACRSTARGFADVVRALPRARETSERYLEGVFFLRARTEGNDVGYHSIVAAGPHATTLHWTDNDGPVRDGDLLLLDAGVETRDLYTADVTRVLPVSGHFTPLQRELYELNRAANDAALAELAPGRPYRAFHRAAMRVLAYGLADLGLLPCPADQALDPASTVYRRWTLCGSGHMLGLDVHDCAAARAAEYLDGTLAPGHVLTVEPGLYFQPDDLLVPAEFRGLGYRIEENVLITADGYEMLSDDLPRAAADVESWMSTVDGER
ncbi:MAG TPA: aminopeptidase P family protein [Actinocatenispora sp.]